LFGSFVTALLVAILTWGTAVGLGILAFAFATHVLSAVDAIRQYAFPSFGRVVPAVTASAGLGTLFYAPALAMASIYAWPIAVDDRPRDGFLVNRWSYQQSPPKSGETVWIGSKRGPSSRVARVVAGSGQRVEWAEDQLRVDDELVETRIFGDSEAPSELKLTIPEGHLLVVDLPASRRDAGPTGRWEIVELKSVRGRAWARSYPIWERSLLP
jgi:hypothetical protein